MKLRVSSAAVRHNILPAVPNTAAPNSRKLNFRGFREQNGSANPRSYVASVACLLWQQLTGRSGAHGRLQIRENAVRESVANNFIKIAHIKGTINLADLFTKEDRDVSHFLSVRDQLLTSTTE